VAVRSVRGRGQAREGDEVKVTLMAPRLVRSGWLLRLRVQNLGRPATFEGEVSRLERSRFEPRRSSVPLAWRHDEGTRQVRLGCGDAEVLRLATARTASPDPDLLLLNLDDQIRRSEWRSPVGADRPVFVAVRIRDAESKQIVTEKCISISFREHDLVPTVVFARDVDYGPGLPIPSGPVATDQSAATDPFAPAPSGTANPPGVQASDSSPGPSREAWRSAPLDVAYLQDILRCSVCASSYEVGDEALTCSGCGLRFPVLEGVPVLTKDSTVETKLEGIDYDAVHGVTEQRIGRTGARWKEMLERLGLERECALEIGAGTGALTRGLLQEKAVGRLTATDVSHKFLGMLGARIPSCETPVSLIACDANEQHFRPEAFDLVVGNLILHHLLDYDVTLRTCHDMLKPGGAAVFFEPVLKGKIIVTLLLALMLKCEETTRGGVLSPADRQQVRRQIQNHLKSKSPQDRESLAQMEDKYIFSIEQLRETGKQAGFAQIDFLNNEEVAPTYWPYFVETCRSIGIAREKCEHYEWIGEQFANTYGLMFSDQLVTPSGYFVLRK
jgi:ubiquinone/menaquinone biosynthesis C-methylase UbiE/uncharacterized protein YbaR (Trm112 family)